MYLALFNYKTFAVVWFAFFLISCSNFNEPLYSINLKFKNGKVLKQPDKINFSEGESVNLTAIPDSGFIFYEWGNELVGSSVTLTIKLDKNYNITANFVNKDSAVVKDYDGNTYKIVRIGDQVWTSENLKTTTLNDGTPISMATGNENSYLGSYPPLYKWCNNDSTNKQKYGALYNWYAIGKLAPKGWHVSSVNEWSILLSNLMNNGYNWDGSKNGNKIAKSLASITDWKTNSTLGTIGCEPAKNNRSGFNALPTNENECIFWCQEATSSMLAWSPTLKSDRDSLLQYVGYKSSFNSVRLVKD